MTSPIYLRALELSDLDQVLRWHNDAALYESLGGTFRPVSRLSEEEWLRRRVAYSENEINLAICTVENEQHIGNIYLRDIDWISRRAEMHVFIGETVERNRGYGTAAIRWLIEYVFQQLGLVRIYLFVLSDNRAAISVYQRCGFSLEGTLRKHVLKNGELKDVVVMGLCSSDITKGTDVETQCG